MIRYYVFFTDGLWTRFTASNIAEVAREYPDAICIMDSAKHILILDKLKRI